MSQSEKVRVLSTCPKHCKQEDEGHEGQKLISKLYTGHNSLRSMGEWDMLTSMIPMNLMETGIDRFRAAKTAKAQGIN